MFYDAAIRLMRKKWPDAQQLAEELFAIFRGDTPATTKGPVAIDQNADGATPFTIRMRPGDTGPAINIVRGDTVIPIGGFNTPDVGAVGGIDLGGLDFPNPTPDAPAATPTPDNNPFVLYGELAGQVSGNTYQAKVWGKPPGANPAMATINVRFPQVDSADTLPTDFLPVIVLCFPGPGTTPGRKTILDAVAIAPTFLPRAGG